MAVKTLQDLISEGVAGRHILVRSDFNVPLNEAGEITDAGRITASLPTIKALSEAGAKVILMAHLGRPKGQVNPKFSLAPVATALTDGFGVVHRAQASVYDVAQRLPHYAGGLVQKEIDVLKKVAEAPERPYVVVLGGAKVSDKLGVIQALAQKADKVIIGGGMCYTFLAAQGINVQQSLLQEEQIDKCKELLEEFGSKLVLPVDLVAAASFAADADNKIVPLTDIPEGWMSLDVGPETVKKYADVLATAKTVFWNGPMGVFEFAAFANGTRGVAEAIINATKAGAFSVVGGGDSAAAVRQLGLDEAGFSHISTGGGASLEYLEGKTLPGVAVLES